MRPEAEVRKMAQFLRNASKGLEGAGYPSPTMFAQAVALEWVLGEWGGFSDVEPTALLEVK